MKHKKRALFQSVISLIVCLSMLVGTTFAWFTDTVSSTGNIIKSGNLKVGMEWTADLASPDWKDASQEAIFNYSDWEPGYTDLKYLKISNKGNLAFQYQLTIEEAPASSTGITADGGEPADSQGDTLDGGEVAAIAEDGGLIGEGGNVGNETTRATVSDAMKLAEVIDVYYANVTNKIQSREDAMNLTKIGTLADLIKTQKATAQGVLLPAPSMFTADVEAPASMNPDTGFTTAAIMLKMREDAGNEYMGLTPENGYCVKVFATQYAYEQDSFGADYDGSVTLPGLNGGIGGTISDTASVDTQDGLTTAEVNLGGEEGGATVPAGVQVNEGTTELSLAISQKDASESGIEKGENENLIPLDVHIEGVSPDNTTPIRVNLGKILPEGMNIGNVTLYHVETSGTNPMTQVFTLEELDAHNEFYYDPATGNVIVSMATFSEVALLSDKEAIWEGKIAENFAGGTGTEADPYIIANADQLAYLNKIVSEGEDVSKGKFYKLTADINFGGNATHIWYPIGYWAEGGDIAVAAFDDAPEAAYIIEEDTKSPASAAAVADAVWYTYGGAFQGTFDGAGHTISNIYQNTWSMDGDYDNGYWNEAMGLFGYVYDGTIKNLTVHNFQSDGEFTPTGVIAAYAANSTFENIAITDCNPRVYNTGNGGIVGIGGNSSDTSDKTLTFNNITIDNSNKISALWGSWDVACGGIMGMFRGYSSVEFNNCHVAAQIDVYNDVCGNYQYYWYRYAGMMIGSLRGRNTTDAQGYTVPDLTGITADNCTVHFGNWNDYYYCELVANSLASYTHDHQFSRLEKVAVLPESAEGNKHYYTEDENGNIECRHFIAGVRHNHEDSGTEIVNGKEVLKENNQRVYLPFNQLFQGDGWGVKHIPIYDDGTTYFEGITILGRENANSVVKFESNGETEVFNNIEIKASALFSYIDNCGVAIKNHSFHMGITNLDENGNVTAEFKRGDTWGDSTIMLTGTGRIEITAQDYYFCTPSTITVDVKDRIAAEKFTGKNVETKTAYSRIDLSDLFVVNDGVDLGNVIVEILAPDGQQQSIDATNDTWRTKTIDLIADGPWKVSIKDNDQYCKPTEVSFKVKEADKFTEKLDRGLLYRVGNQNPVALSSLFNETQTTIAVTEVSVSIENIAGDANGTYTPKSEWNSGELAFTGTGVVRVTISAEGAKELPVEFEIVNATNVPENGTIQNYNVSSVLLGDTTVSTLYLNGGATLYGNGFTIDCTKSPVSGSGSVSENYIIALDGAHLDNVKVIGKVYTEYGAMASNNYNRALVVSKGNSSITNCYLSNTASPIRLVEGNLHVKGTTVKGGNFSNIDIRNGHLTIEDVTTINEATSNDKADNDTTVIGLGIVVYYENVDTNLTSVTIEGSLTQHNLISSNDKFSHEYATQLVSAMMENEYKNFQTTAGNETWVNPGYVAMSKVVPTDNRDDKGGYNGMDVRFAAQDGYVYAAKPAEADIGDAVSGETTPVQGTIAPEYEFDYTSKNYVAKTEGSNNYCYYENGKVLISMNQGETFEWDPFILTATKNGNILDYTVTMNDKTYASGEKIKFNTSGEYVVAYTYTDDYNYKLRAIEQYGQKYVKTVIISVSVMQPTAKHAEFTFGSTNMATEKLTVNNKTYISAKGVSAADKQWGYITVNGQKVFYPIINAEMKTSSKLLGGKETQVYYYVFKDAVTITDYKDGGTGNEQLYNADTKVKPSNLAVVNGMEAKYTGISSACVDISKLTKDGPSGEVWDFSASTTVSGTTTYNECLAYQSPSGLSVKDGTRDYDAITVAQFSYTDAAGATYYYFIGYFMPNQNTSDSGSGGGCVTPDTLITLANSKQVRVDSLTGKEDLLVWNHEIGAFDSAPVAYIINHDEVVKAQTITCLTFSDGNEIKIIGEHVFFDVTLNRYVPVTSDNAKDYIGHVFTGINSTNDALTAVKLVKAETFVEETSAYEVVTYKHLTCFTNNMLSTSAYLDKLLNIFDINPTTMAYSAEKVANDIAKYGLYTYGDFDGLISEEAFELYNAAYLKIAVGKGYITWNDILDLIDIYFAVDVKPIQ